MTDRVTIHIDGETATGAYKWTWVGNLSVGQSVPGPGCTVKRVNDSPKGDVQVRAGLSTTNESSVVTKIKAVR